MKHIGFSKKKLWCPRNHFLPVKQTCRKKRMREPIGLMKVKYNLETTTPTAVLNLQIFQGHKWYSQEAFGCPWYQFTKVNMVNCHGMRWGFPHRSKNMPCQKWSLSRMKVYYEISRLLVSYYFFMRTEMKHAVRLHLGPHRVIISPKFSCSFWQKFPPRETSQHVCGICNTLSAIKQMNMIQPTNNEQKTPNFYKHSGFANHIGCVVPTDSTSNTQTAMAVLKRIYFWHVRTTIHLPNDVPMTS